LMLSDIAFWVMVPLLVLLLWVVFWDSIVYRAILYVIYGKKK
jgi:hypothetical protein